MGLKEKLINRRKIYKLKTAVIAGTAGLLSLSAEAKPSNDVAVGGGNAASADVKKWENLRNRPANDWKLGDFTVDKECRHNQRAISPDGGYGLYQISVDTKARYIDFLRRHSEYNDIYNVLKNGINKTSWYKACDIESHPQAQTDFWFSEYLPGGFSMLRDKMQKADLPSNVKNMKFTDLHPAVVDVLIDMMNHHGSFTTMVIPAMEANYSNLNSAKFIRDLCKNRYAAHKHFADKIDKKAFKARLDDLEAYSINNLKKNPSWQLFYEEALAVGEVKGSLQMFTQRVFDSGKSSDEIAVEIDAIVNKREFKSFAEAQNERNVESQRNSSRVSTSKSSTKKSVDKKPVVQKYSETTVVSRKETPRTVSHGDLGAPPSRTSERSISSGDLGAPPSNTSKRTITYGGR